MTLNDFFTWNMRRFALSNDLPPLTEDDCDELFSLFAEAGLPDTAMSAEMADGYLTACVIGPEPPAVHHWMEGIFGQPTLPICANGAQQEQLLELLLRRHRAISDAMRVPRSSITQGSTYMPLTGQVAPEDRVAPYRLDENGVRLGDWDLKEWAAGFQRGVVEEPKWRALVSDPKVAGLLGPLTLLLAGYNPDHREVQIDTQQDLLPHLVICTYALYDFWHAGDRTTQINTARVPSVNDTPKPGRNDPCPCGSSLKYKKCCGT